MRSHTLNLSILLAMALAGGSLATDSDSLHSSQAERRQERMKRSTNFESRHFVNEVPTSTLEFGELWLPLKDELVPSKRCRPEKPLPSVPVDVAAFDTASGLQAIWLGHSTVLMRIDGVTILVDPVFDEYAKHALGRSLRFQPSPLARGRLPKVAAVIISHDHFDHLEQTTVQHLTPGGAIFFVPLGVGALLEAWRVPDSQIVELDWWEAAEFQGLQLVCTPARHFSGRDFASINRTLWATWTVVGPNHRLFFGGDTGYLETFKQIGEKFGPFDLTLIPIGAYDDAWADIHLRPEEAVIVHKYLKGRVLLPIHWGVFDLSSHWWMEPITRLTKAAAMEQIELVAPRLGEVVDADNPRAFERWWQGLE